MSQLIVHPARRPLSGSIPVPSDKSIGHRALIFSALAGGTSKIRGFSYGEDNVATMAAFRGMGISIDDDGQGGLVVEGKGLEGLSAAQAPLDCGNSGTTMRLLAGVMAAQPFQSTLTGDASLSRRPMGRIAGPLRARGAVIEGTPHPAKKDDIIPPLRIGPRPGPRLLGLDYRMPISSAQVKSCLLLSGLFAAAPTVLYEPLVSRDHTERMLSALGMPIEVAGTMVSLHPPADPRAIPGFKVELPGDISAAAFVLCAGQIVEGSLVTTRATGLNPTRTGILDVIRQLGGLTATETQGDALGEPFGEITSKFSELRAGIIGGELALRSLDEIPIASALAARARGTTQFVDVGELRVKESDRIARMVEVLRAFGLQVEERPDGFAVEGRPDEPLSPARVTSHGDHRIAMTAAILGLVASGESVIDDADCIATSFPRFAGTLRALGAQVEVIS